MAMPVENSRLRGFFRLSVEERLDLVSELANLSEQQRATLLSGGGLDHAAAEMMVENVISTMSLPVGIATNFIIDGEHFIIPYCIEESSVIAAASNMAKRCQVKGGFQTDVDDSLMIGQIQILGVADIDAAMVTVVADKQRIIEICNSQPSTMVELGGGCKDVRCRKVEDMLVVHILVDCLDAMGANAVNTMAERVAPHIEGLVNGQARLRIVSNLAIHRLARATAIFTAEEISHDGSREDGVTVISGILDAYRFAALDPFRAATHNKGTMNAISAVALACGQDWRAIEAGCHAWVAFSQGRYGSITTWEVDESGDLVGSIEVPLAVGTIGGAVRVHPVAKANLAILGISSAKRLAAVMVCAGLAQNLAAMRALSTSGIQAGHMSLHVRNMAVSAGALVEEIDAVAELSRKQQQPLTQKLVDSLLAQHRQDS